LEEEMAEVDAIFIDQWASEVKLAFQQMTSYLRDSIRTVTGVTGQTYRFPLIGAGTATVNKPRHADMLPMGVNHSDAIALINPYTAMEMLDALDEVRTNADLRSAYTDSVVAALSRALDQEVINALDATTNDETNNLPTSNTLDTLGLTYVGQVMSQAFVPHEDRYCLASPSGMADVLQDDRLVNALYVEKGALEEGYARGVVGFDIIESALVSGGTASSGNATNYFYHKRAVGLAIAEDITIDVAWVPLKQAWMFAGRLAAGAIIIDPAGVYKASIAN
jgi:hypothetical protein